jgi:hypothetical protein
MSSRKRPCSLRIPQGAYRLCMGWTPVIAYVELIVAECPWEPPGPCIPADTLVDLRIGFAEVEIRERVKQAGGKWNPHRKVWELRYAQVVALKLETRIVEPILSRVVEHFLE